MDTNRDSARQSQNEDNFATFSLGLEFLNEAEKEKNNGKGDSASAPSRFASLSEGEMQQSLLMSLSVFRVRFDGQIHRLCYKTIVHAFSCALSSYGARGKFGEHERSVRLARGDS